MSVEITQYYPEYLSWLGLVKLLGCQTYVEIGTESGGSIKMAKRILPEVRMATVDITSYPRHFQAGVYYVQGDSRSPDTLRNVRDVLETESFDAVFVDGDHAYEGVKADFELWWPVTRKIMAFHDIATHNLPDVLRFWKEVSLPRRSVAFHIPPNQASVVNCGIGVLMQPECWPDDALEDLFAYAGGKYAS